MFRITGFQPSPENPETLWQLPVFNGLGEIKTAWLAFQQFKIVDQLIEELILLPATPVDGDEPIAKYQTDFFNSRNHRDLAVSVLGRNGIGVAIEANQ